MTTNKTQDQQMLISSLFAVSNIIVGVTHAYLYGHVDGKHLMNQLDMSISNLQTLRERATAILSGIVLPQGIINVGGNHEGNKN